MNVVILLPATYFSNLFTAVIEFVIGCAFRCVAPKGKGENDYRPLFDVFVNDLLTMTNMPEWPSAELVLKILGGLLVCVCTLF